MGARVLLTLFLLLFELSFPFCYAQCTLDVPDSQLLSALNLAGILRETDQSKFSVQDRTYLCFVRSTTNSKRYDQVRISVLYSYDTATNQSAQVTFSVCLFNAFRFSEADVTSVKEGKHFTENMTREGCQNCQDSKTSPTYCKRTFCLRERVG